MARWLMESPGVSAVDAHPDSQVAARLGSAATPDVVLVNQRLAPGTFRLLRESGMLRQPGVRVLEHGIYHDSDEIFVSVSGVARGYFLRRVDRTALLDPLLRSFPAGPPEPREADRQISRYFQQLLEPRSPGEEHPPAELTMRETQILELLRRGLVDKEIAAELGISVWTVHSHLKRMFTKLGVRRRAEAVARYIYK
jgi:DNA-binding NarL/FixJ family response regulator